MKTRHTGEQVWFKPDFGEPRWYRGTIRAIGGPLKGGRQLRVDNGDPLSDDLQTNGFTVSAWVSSDLVSDETPEEARQETLF